MAQGDLVEDEGDALCVFDIVGSNDNLRNKRYARPDPTIKSLLKPFAQDMMVLWWTVSRLWKRGMNVSGAPASPEAQLTN